MPAKKTALLDLEDIHKTYIIGEQSQHVLRGVNLKVNHGEVVSIMGQSGCGKSTLMNLMGLLDRPDKGHYLFEGRDVKKCTTDELAELRNRHIGFVFKSFFLLPKLTAIENVELPLMYRGMHKQEMKQRAMAMLEKVHMADWANHKPNELSGGQQQRVAIARALAGEPELVLADEPTGALDPRIGSDVLKLFLNLNEQTNTTLVIITHDPSIAKQCKHQVRMEDGKIVDVKKL